MFGFISYVHAFYANVSRSWSQDFDNTRFYCVITLCEFIFGHLFPLPWHASHVYVLLRIVFDPPDETNPKGFKPEALLQDWDRPFLELADGDVPGRINDPKFFSFWRDVLEAPADVLEIIQHGYSVPFIDGILPPPAFAANNQSALRNSEFLLKELFRLEGIGCIERIPYQPRIVLPCSVVFSNKWRLVTDASRHINPWVVKNKVKLDSLDTAEELMLRGDFLSKQDLCSGYFHILLAEHMRDNFGVHFVLPSGEILFWRWRVLFLGERNAVWLFTKLLKPHRKFLAKRGVRHCLMIDDFLIMSRSFMKNLLDTQKHLWALEQAGWVVKEEKCQNHPSREIEFLGIFRLIS